MARTISLLLLLGLIAGGCASTQPLTNDPADPWEGFNRRVYSFNDALDRAILVPVATGYRAVTPEFVEDGVGNFFSNIGDFGVAVNNTLQFKFLDATSDVGRIVVNTTIGLLSSGALVECVAAYETESSDPSGVWNPSCRRSRR